MVPEAALHRLMSVKMGHWRQAAEVSEDKAWLGEEAVQKSYMEVEAMAEMR